MTPRITVTIPTYNRAHLLGRSLRSVLDQHVDGMELIVSDNASTDDTEQIVRSFDDPRVRYVRNAENIGARANLSSGFSRGSAPLVALFPDDDVMLPGTLEPKVALLERDPAIGLVFSPVYLAYFDEGGSETERTLATTWGADDAVISGADALLRLLTTMTWIHFPSVVVRRELVVGERFDEADGMVDDFAMFLRVVQRCNHVAHLADPSCAISMHIDQFSVESAMYSPGTRFTPALTMLSDVRAARERFLVSHAPAGQDLERIRKLARRRDCYQALQYARYARDEKGVAATARAIREAAAFDIRAGCQVEAVRALVRASRLSASRMCAVAAVFGEEIWHHVTG